MLRALKDCVLQHAQVVGTLMLLAISGNETTTKLIGNMAYRLWQHTDQRQLLIDDPSLIGNSVADTMRFDGSSQIIVRRAGKDVTLHGQTIPGGARIAPCIIFSYLDTAKYTHPDHLDWERHV